MGKKELICLANSRKLNGRCIAGKEPEKLWWVRPVSDTETGEIYADQIKLNPKPLDIVSYSFLRYKTNSYHPENLIMGNTAWEKIGEYPFEKIDVLCDKPDALWTNEEPDSHKISLEFLLKNKIPSSLYLIKPELFEIFSEGEYRADGNPKLRAVFKYNGKGYVLPITDIEFEMQFRDIKPNENYRFNTQDIYLCVSLSEPHNGFCYKLIASIIQKPKSTKDKSPEKIKQLSDGSKTRQRDFVVTIEEPIRLHTDTIWTLWFLAKDSLENDELNQFIDIYQLLKNIKTPGGNVDLDKIMSSLVKRYDLYLKGVKTRGPGETENVVNNSQTYKSDNRTKDSVSSAIFQIISNSKFNIGRSFLQDVLKGSKSKRILESGFDQSEFYGMLSDYTGDQIISIIDELITEGYLEIRQSLKTNYRRPILVLTEKSGKLLKNETPEEPISVPKTTPNQAKPEEFFSKDQQDLLKFLKERRLTRANSDRVPAFVIAPDRSLMEIVEKHIKTKEELSQVYGFGKKRIEKYGDEIIGWVLDFSYP